MKLSVFIFPTLILCSPFNEGKQPHLQDYYRVPKQNNSSKHAYYDHWDLGRQLVFWFLTCNSFSAS